MRFSRHNDAPTTPGAAQENGPTTRSGSSTGSGCGPIRQLRRVPRSRPHPFGHRRHRRAPDDFYDYSADVTLPADATLHVWMRQQQCTISHDPSRLSIADPSAGRSMGSRPTCRLVRSACPRLGLGRPGQHCGDSARSCTRHDLEASAGPLLLGLGLASVSNR